MNDEEIEQFRHKLVNLRSELQDLVESSIEATGRGEPDQTGIGSRSLMNTLLMQQRAQEGARRRQRQLLKIDGALRRIESGEYGTCFICEEDLDVLRLSEDPAITRCVKCIEL